MLIFAFIVVWVFVSAACHWHYWSRRAYKPEWWEKRHMHLKPFTERQWLWCMTLWPLAIVGGLMLIVMLIILGIIDNISRLYNERKERRNE